MPTIDFGGCLSNYWFVWTINGLGSIFSLAINMAISFFCLKYFHNIASGSPSAPKKPKSDFSNYSQQPPVYNGMPVGTWGNDTMMGNAFQVSSL